MLWAGFLVLWIAAGTVSTNFSWNEEVDEFYGGLRPNWRYVFFVVMIVFWPIWALVFKLRAWRRKPDEDE
jgi:hypothetical protein